MDKTNIKDDSSMSVLKEDPKFEDTLDQIMVGEIDSTRKLNEEKIAHLNV
jgi:hypothetical protein